MLLILYVISVIIVIELYVKSQISTLSLKWNPTAILEHIFQRPEGPKFETKG